MAPITQIGRTMGFKCSLGLDALLLKTMTAEEALGRPFAYHVELLSENAEIAMEDLIGQAAEVWIIMPSGEPRVFAGVVTRFALVGNNEQGLAIYEAELRPWLWLLTRTAECKIFQQMKVPDIVLGVFRDAGFADFDQQLSETYRTWDYCVQYRETAFNFVNRLLEQEGMYYYFDHSPGKHKLLLADSPSAHSARPGYETIPFRPESRARVGEEFISSWTVEQSLQPGRYMIRDFDFTKPRQDLTSKLKMESNHAHADKEIYDYPGEYVQPDEGTRYVRLRMEEQVAEQQVVTGRTNAIGFQVGSRFSLTDYPRADQNKEYLAISATYQVVAPSYHGGGEGEGAQFHCSFRAIPSERPYRVARSTPKPIVQGPQTAIVVGPAGEEIYTDEHGRVKVQFHWDRLGERNENSSCWIRVSQPWAGKTWGGIAIPRIGHEVIVEFLEGDPDRPIITGRVYNGDNHPPYKLPDFKTQTGMKTRSTKEGTEDNFNEIRFEDLKGSEHIYVHAERDEDVVVERNQTISVGADRSESTGHDRSLTVGNDKTENVSNDKTVTIASKHTESIGAEMTLNVGANRTVSVGSALAETVGAAASLEVTKGRQVNVGEELSISVGKDHSLSVGGTSGSTVAKGYTVDAKTITLNAKDKILIKTGKASITMKKDGTISIEGKKITVKGSGDVVIKGSKIAEN